MNRRMPNGMYGVVIGETGLFPVSPIRFCIIEIENK